MDTDRDEKLQINFAWFYLLILHKRLECSRSPTSYAIIAIGPIYSCMMMEVVSGSYLPAVRW